MNGIHDMGGMQDMGPIGYAKTEPVFHATWEGRIYAISTAVQATGKLRLGVRPPIASMSPIDYLTSSYYEKWLVSITERMVASGLTTRAEVASGRAESPKLALALSPAQAAAALFKVPQTWRDVPGEARFQVGQDVRAGNINPVTHTRLPRYARGKAGTIALDHGAFVFHARKLGLPPTDTHHTANQSYCLRAPRDTSSPSTAQLTSTKVLSKRSASRHWQAARPLASCKACVSRATSRRSGRSSFGAIAATSASRLSARPLTTRSTGRAKMAGR